MLYISCFAFLSENLNQNEGWGCGLETEDLLV